MEMTALQLIDKFTIDPNTGELIVPTMGPNGELIDGYMDFNRLTPEAVGYLAENLWIYIKPYNFADHLKSFCSDVLGLTFEQVHGSDKDKNSKTKIKWENLPYYDLWTANLPSKEKPRGYMTAREVMQKFGDIIRSIKSDAWCFSTINRIQKERSDLAIIGDLRFSNELKAVHDAGGKVIRLLRNSDSLGEDSHESEIALVNCQDFDYIIDNRDISINEKNNRILNVLQEWGWADYIVNPKSVHVEYQQEATI